MKKDAGFADTNQQRSAPRTRLLVRLVALGLLATSAVAVPAYAGTMLKGGRAVSDALGAYAQGNGWTVEWAVRENYFLDEDLAMPGHNVVADVQWLLKHYAGQGVFAGAGIEVDSEARRVRVVQKVPSATAAQDLAVQLRLSAPDLMASRVRDAHPDLKPMVGVKLEADFPANAVLHTDYRVDASLAPMPVDIQELGTVDYAAHVVEPLPSWQVTPEPIKFTAPTQVSTQRQALSLASADLAETGPISKDSAEPAASMQSKRSSRRAHATTPANVLLTDAGVVALKNTTVGSPNALLSAAGAPAPEGVPDDLAQVLAEKPALTKAEAALVASIEPVGIKSIAAPEKPAPKWVATNGMSLRSAVTEWAAEAGWTIKWDTPVDYDILGTLSYEGEFLEAAQQIFAAHAGVERPLQAEAYPRQHLIHVKE